MSRARIFIENTFWIYVSKIVTQVMTLITTVLVINKLAVEIYGEFNFFLSSLLVCQSLTLNPLIHVINRYVPELSGYHELQKIKKLLLRGLVLTLLSFGCLAFFIVYFRYQVAVFFHLPSLPGLLTVFLILVLCYFLQMIGLTVIKALLLNKQAALIAIVISFAKSVMYLVWLSELDVALLLEIETGLASASFLFSLAVMILFYKKTGTTVYPQPGNQGVDKNRVIRYGIYSYFNDIGGNVIGTTSDTYIVSAMAGQFSLGVYAFASKIFNMILYLLPVKDVLTIIRPMFIQKFSQKHEEAEFNRIYNFIPKILLPIYLFPSLFFLLFGRGYIRLFFNEQYFPAYGLINIMLLTNITSAVFYPLVLVVLLKERMDVALYGKIIGLFSIPAGIVGMHFFSLTGVAVATTLGDFFKDLLVYFKMRKMTAIRYHFLDYYRYLTATAVLMLIFLYPVRWCHTSAVLIALSFVFFILYCLLLLRFHPLNRDDRCLLNLVIGSSRFLSRLCESAPVRWFKSIADC
ncbi:MAG: lipopolysaccharide biosynthesis protein [Candidatus Aureabacteria bacterium]|nr:lipopolysaccharide biosynthesis protein [Candidatus Auribacterota bacterium]